jgi:hypothetical protein
MARGQWAQQRLFNHPESSGPGSKPFSARWTLHPLKINPLHLGGCNDLPAFRAKRVERRQHFFEIDLLSAGHGSEDFNSSPGGLAHLYVLCKGGDDRVGCHSFSFASATKLAPVSHHPRRYYGTKELPFITCSCYHHKARLASPAHQVHPPFGR